MKITSALSPFAVDICAVILTLEVLTLVAETSLGTDEDACDN
jgi:hypothetical protein